MPLAQVFFEVFGCVPSGHINVFELIFGRCLRPGLLRDRFWSDFRRCLYY